MKMLNKILSLAILLMGLSSCLKDEMIENQKYGIINHNAYKVVEIPKGSGLRAVALDLVNESKTIEFLPIHLAAENPASEDIKVTLSLAKSDELITAYNTVDANDDGTPDNSPLVLLPANLYTLPNGLEVTIPKGGKDATLELNINPSTLDPAITYAIAFEIQELDKAGYVISGNFNYEFITVAVKNKYDGNYEVTATAPMVDILVPTISGYYPLDSDLRTIDANSVVMFCHTYLEGYEGHPIKNNGASSYYGNFAPVFIMDENGNVTSVINYYGQGTNGSGRSARLDVSGVNKFTVNSDDEKVLEVSYVLQGPGSVDRTFFHEKWVYKGKRQ